MHTIVSASNYARLKSALQWANPTRGSQPLCISSSSLELKSICFIKNSNIFKSVCQFLILYLDATFSTLKTVLLTQYSKAKPAVTNQGKIVDPVINPYSTFKTWLTLYNAQDVLWFVNPYSKTKTLLRYLKKLVTFWLLTHIAKEKHWKSKTPVLFW